MNHRTNLVVLRRIASVCIILLCIAPDVKAQPGPTKVVVAQASMKDMPATAILVGTVDAVRRSRVGAEIASVVVTMPIRQGDAVTEGQVLCTLDNRRLGFQLAQERAKLGSLKAVHEELLAGTRPEVLERLNARVSEYDALRQRWSYEVDRVTSLYSDAQAGSQKEVYDAKAELAASTQRKRAAQADYDEAKNGPRMELIDQASHNVSEQQAIVHRLEVDFEKTTIRAPFAGFVIRRTVEVGEWVNAGDEIVEIVDLSTVLVRVFVPESAINYCTVGSDVTIRIDALKRSVPGRIQHRILLADPKARTFPVEIAIVNTDYALAAGMFARATVPTGPTEKMVAVPKDAVIEKQGTSYVAMIVPGEQGLMAMPTPVTTGLDVQNWVSITSGNIPEGVSVVIRGNESIYYPMPVMIVDDKGRPVEDRHPGQKKQ